MIKIIFIVFTHAIFIFVSLSIFSINIAHSLFWLTFSYVNTSILFLRLGSGWASSLILLIYSGALAIVFIISLVLMEHQIIQERLSIGAMLAKPMIVGSVFTAVVLVSVCLTKDHNQWVGELKTNGWVKHAFWSNSVVEVANVFFSSEPLLSFLCVSSLLVPMVLILLFVS